MFPEGQEDGRLFPRRGGDSGGEEDVAAAAGEGRPDRRLVASEAQARRRIDQARGEAFRAIVAHLKSEVVVDADTFQQLERKMMDGF